MAVRKIETTIALSGEQQFKRAMSDAAREIRVQETALKALSAAYENNGDKAAMLTGKQSLLKQQIAQQEQIVQALKSRFDKFSADPEKNFREIQSLSIEYNAATARLEKYKKALSSTDREIEELGRDAIKAGRQIEEGIGDGAREAENELTDLMSTMQDSLSAIQSNTAVTAIKTVWDTATGAFNAIDGFVTGTTDYRRQLSFLIQNAGTMDFGLDETEDMLVKTQTITADASAAIEGLSNLFRVEGMSEYRLNRVMENLLGASITWPDTMKFESLSESFQETLATGQAVGQYGALLERLGVNLDEFNKALDESKTPEGDLEAAIAYMTSNELSDAYNKYKEDNSELIKELETIARLEFQSARLGGILARNLTTPLKDTWADTLDWVNDTLETWEADGLDAAIAKVKADIETAKATFDVAMEAAGMPTISELMDIAKLMTPQGLAEAAREKTAGYVTRRLSGIKENAVSYDDYLIATGQKKEVGKNKNGFRISAQSWDDEDLREANEAIERMNALVEKGMVDENQAQYWQSRYISGNLVDSELLETIAEYEEVASVAAREAGSNAGQQYAEGFEEWLDPTTWGEGKEVTSLQVIGQRSMDDVLAGIDLDAYYKEMNGAGKEGGAELMEGLEEGSEGAATAGMAAGAAFGGAFAAGLTSQVSYVAASAGALAAAAAAAARAVSAPSMAVGGGVNLALNIDGKTFARATAPYMSGELAVDAR